jgi:hypothetical protein
VVRSLLVAGLSGSSRTRVIRSAATSYSIRPAKNDTWKYNVDSSGVRIAGRTASDRSVRPNASSRGRMSMVRATWKVRVSAIVIFRSPLVQSCDGSSRSVFTSPIDMFHR